VLDLGPPPRSSHSKLHFIGTMGQVGPLGTCSSQYPDCHYFLDIKGGRPHEHKRAARKGRLKQDLDGGRTGRGR
jgi:hypothetical protein